MLQEERGKKKPYSVAQIGGLAGHLGLQLGFCSVPSFHSFSFCLFIYTDILTLGLPYENLYKHLYFFCHELTPQRTVKNQLKLSNCCPIKLSSAPQAPIEPPVMILPSGHLSQQFWFSISSLALTCSLRASETVPLVKSRRTDPLNSSLPSSCFYIGMSLWKRKNSLDSLRVISGQCPFQYNAKYMFKVLVSRISVGED